jgi:hypothetical protein
MKKFDMIVIVIMGMACISLVIVLGVVFSILRSRAAAIQTAALYTQGAQTLSAEVTLQAIQTYASQTTPLLPTPSTIPTYAYIPSSTPVQYPTLTSSYPTAVYPTVVYPSAVPPTAVPPPCNAARFVKDVTVPDGTLLPPNASFTKVWRLQNIGSCTWDSRYSLVFVNGDRMSGASPSALTQVVAPGNTVDVSVALVAPTSSGKFKGNWMLQNPSGGRFGIGSNSSQPFWVSIQSLSRNSGWSYDLGVNICMASWRSSAGNLPCQGNPNSSAGSEVLIFNPVFETGREENEATLWTRPQNKAGGWIQGTYPAYTVKTNDHFVSQLGCLKNNSGCDVNFTLDYILSNGTIHNLGQWHEVYDGLITTIDIDLSSLAGSPIQFVLTVTAVNNPAQANAFWFVPSVRQEAPAASPTPTRTSTPTPTATPTATPTPTITTTPNPYPPSDGQSPDTSLMSLDFWVR